ncbi:MAG TPA: hypothetical protein VMZ29_09810 [Candidatus Bathyarchaeia archaeon]|nr:hypothetical protein [Candidatus Bathyarchaeia archaeon]
MFLLNLIGWQPEYFNYWLTHCFYFTALAIIIIAFGSNKILYCKNRIMIMKRLEIYSNAT